MKTHHTLFLLLAMLLARPISAETTTIQVSNEAELNNAIDTFNGAVDDLTIELIDNITLTAHTTLIDQTPALELTIDGNDFSINGGGSFRPIYVYTGTVSINNLQIENGGQSAIRNLGVLSIANSTITNNARGSEPGGGINNYGQLTVTDSAITNNSGSSGGGFYHEGASLVIERSLIAGNSAGSGAGLYSLSGDGHVTISNSTFSGNTATSAGGALVTGSNGPTVIAYTTIVGNTAPQAGGIGYADVCGGNCLSPLSLHATIVVGNSSDDLGIWIGSQNDFVSHGYNVLGTVDSSIVAFNETGDSTGNNAAATVASLADNGGSTLTHALAEGSPAINGGNPADCPDTDQRGFPRNDGLCDSGAFEGGSVIADVVKNVELGDTVTFTNSVGVEMFVTGDTDLECLSAEQINANHPNADDTLAELTQESGTFWRFHAYQADCNTAASDFEITLTLPHAGYDAPQLCRWTGADWDCAVNSADASSATATGITSFSDWAIGYPPSADLVLTKSADVTSVERDDLFTYTLNVTNTGTLPAASVVLTDTLPSSVTPLAPSVALDGNLLRYHFDETSGNAIDTSGNGYNGAIIGATQGAAGQIGNSYSFDGSDDYVLAGGGVVPAFEMSNSLTMALWVYPTGSGGGNFGGGEFYGTIINREGEYQLYRHQDGDVWFTIANGNPGWAAINMGNLTPQDSWTHLVFTYDANAASDQIKLYVNGALTYTRAGSGAIGDFVTTTTLDELRIGGRQADTAAIFEGQIDEVYLYNRAISAVEAQSLYSSINGVGNCTGAFVCELGGLPAGSSATVTLPVQVNSDATGATIDNTATVAALGGDVRSADNSDTVSIALFTPTTVDLSNTLTQSPSHWEWFVLTALLTILTIVAVRPARQD